MGRKMTIRWLLAKTEVLVHYDMLVEKAEATDDKTTKHSCKPGEDNIVCLFVNYLNFLNEAFRAGFKFVPELQSYVNEVM